MNMSLKCVIAAAVLALSAAAANATTFNIAENLIFQNFIAPPHIPGICPVCDGPGLPNGTLTGTVDIINGSITSFDLNANVDLGFHFTTGNATVNGLRLAVSGAPIFSAFLDLGAGTYEAGSSDAHDPIGKWTFVPPIPTPLPAALPLFATGLGALGLLGWRRKRKAQAAA